jgi:hypothetical protein
MSNLNAPINGKKMCTTCNGSRRISKINLLKAKTEFFPCPDCKGMGYTQTPQTDGIRCGVCEAITYFWQFLKASKVAATLEIRVRPIKNDRGVPQVYKNVIMKIVRPRAYVEIVRMNTKPEFRHLGMMSALVDCALGDSKIEWAETNWDDSTGDGRNWLLERGFVQEGNKLIWERATGGELKFKHRER